MSLHKDHQSSSSNRNQILTHMLKRNRILAPLSATDSTHFISQLEMVRLIKGQIIYHLAESVRFAIFPLSGMISLLSTTEEGSTTEVSMVCNEGVIGIPAVLRINTTPYEVTVQIGGDALRIKGSEFKREFDRGGALQNGVLHYLHTLISLITQSAACNRFHTLDARLCRWLLLTRECIKSDSLRLTQNDLAQMVGASRTNVSTIAAGLQESGAIRYVRGRIKILNLEILKAHSCECYRIISQELSRVDAA